MAPGDGLDVMEESSYLCWHSNLDSSSSYPGECTVYANTKRYLRTAPGNEGLSPLGCQLRYCLAQCKVYRSNQCHRSAMVKHLQQCSQLTKHVFTHG